MGPFREWLDREAVCVIGSSDFEVDFGALLHANRRWVELVLSRRNRNGLNAFSPCRQLGRCAGHDAAHKKQRSGHEQGGGNKDLMVIVLLHRDI